MLSDFNDIGSDDDEDVDKDVSETFTKSKKERKRRKKRSKNEKSDLAKKDESTPAPTPGRVVKETFQNQMFRKGIKVKCRDKILSLHSIIDFEGDFKSPFMLNNTVC